MTFLQRILRGQDQKLLVLFDQGIVSGSNFVLGILIARFLGIHQFGVFGFIQLLILFCLGLQQAFFVMPLYSLGPTFSDGNRKNYLNSLVIIQAGFALLFSVICFVGLTLIPISISSQINEMSELIALTAFLVLIQDFLRRLLLFKNLLKHLILLDCLAFGFQIILLITLFLFNGISLKACLGIISFTMFLSVTYGFYIIGKPELKRDSIKDSLLKHWVYSKWLLARAILTYSSGNFFIIAAGTILGPVAIGAIKMGQNLHGIMNVIFLAIENHVPIVSANLFHKKGKLALYAYLKSTTLKSLLLCSLLGLTILAFSSWLITNLYGNDYQIYGYVLIWFAIINMLVCLSMPLRFALRTFEKTRSLFFSTVLSALFGFLFAYPLIQNFQMNGVLFGLVMSQLLVIIYLAFTIHFSGKKLLKSVISV